MAKSILCNCKQLTNEIRGRTLHFAEPPSGILPVFHLLLLIASVYNPTLHISALWAFTRQRLLQRVQLCKCCGVGVAQPCLDREICCSPAARSTLCQDEEMFRRIMQTPCFRSSAVLSNLTGMHWRDRTVPLVYIS